MEAKIFKFKNDISVVTKVQYEAHLKLYEGYIRKLNEIEKRLENHDDIRKEANATYSTFRELKVEETFATNGIILHELYFQNIGVKGERPLDKTESVIKKYFGSYDNFKEDFTATAISARGWAILVYDQVTKTFKNILLDTHNLGNVAGACPILVLDMYEHAYFYDYLTKKDEYIKAFIESVNWRVVEKRIDIVK